MYKTALNICMHAFLWTYTFLYLCVNCWIIHGPMLVSAEIVKEFSTVLVLLDILAGSIQEFRLLHIPAHAWTC